MNNTGKGTKIDLVKILKHPLDKVYQIKPLVPGDGYFEIDAFPKIKRNLKNFARREIARTEGKELLATAAYVTAYDLLASQYKNRAAYTFVPFAFAIEIVKNPIVIPIKLNLDSVESHKEIKSYANFYDKMTNSSYVIEVDSKILSELGRT